VPLGYHLGLCERVSKVGEETHVRALRGLTDSDGAKLLDEGLDMRGLTMIFSCGLA
jgi:hypothetical protein